MSSSSSSTVIAAGTTGRSTFSRGGGHGGEVVVGIAIEANLMVEAVDHTPMLEVNSILRVNLQISLLDGVLDFTHL